MTNLKVVSHYRNDSCTVRDTYREEIPFCYTKEFSTSSEDRSPYGPDDK